MTTELIIDGTSLPSPTGDLDMYMAQIADEYTTEAGGMVKVRRAEKLRVSGRWLLTGSWVSAFRAFQTADSVTVQCYYPEPGTLSSYTCDFQMIEAYKHKSRKYNPNTEGLYEVSVTIREY